MVLWSVGRLAERREMLGKENNRLAPAANPAPPLVPSCLHPICIVLLARDGSVGLQLRKRRGWRKPVWLAQDLAPPSCQQKVECGMKRTHGRRGQQEEGRKREGRGKEEGTTRPLPDLN